MLAILYNKGIYFLCLSVQSAATLQTSHTEDAEMKDEQNGVEDKSEVDTEA